MAIRLAALGALAPLLIAAAPVPIDRLDWMAGDWVVETGGRWTEEHWTAPRGGAMLGLGRSGKADRMLGFELMRIVTDDAGEIVFWGAPGGRRPVPFRLVSQDGTAVVFENPQHDFPKRIVYRRDGDRLTATVSGGTETAKSWTYRRQPPAGEPAPRK